MIAISSKRFPDVVAYPEQGVAWVATRHPEVRYPREAMNGSSLASSCRRRSEAEGPTGSAQVTYPALT
jgi:hypothetical protein